MTMTTGGELLPIVVQDTAKPLGEAVGNTLAEVWQGILGDRVTAWRIRNAASLSNKLQAEVAKTGNVLNLDRIPEGVAFAWFDKATQSEEPELQDLFAKLLANAATGNADALRKRNIELVSSLSPMDARFLSYTADFYKSFRQAGTSVATFSFKMDFMFARDYRDAGFSDDLPIDSLISLGIYRLDRDFLTDSDKFERTVARLFSAQGQGVLMGVGDLLDVEERLVLTEVGRSLIDALFPTPNAT
jgi:hypothetical protein